MGKHPFCNLISLLEVEYFPIFVIYFFEYAAD